MHSPLANKSGNVEAHCLLLTQALQVNPAEVLLTQVMRLQQLVDLI